MRVVDWIRGALTTDTQTESDAPYTVTGSQSQ